jgi:hypothetical protein
LEEFDKDIPYNAVTHASFTMHFIPQQSYPGSPKPGMRVM